MNNVEFSENKFIVELEKNVGGIALDAKPLKTRFKEDTFTPQLEANTEIQTNFGVIHEVERDARIATKETLGIVQIGDDLDITKGGVLSVTQRHVTNSDIQTIIDKQFKEVFGQ